MAAGLATAMAIAALALAGTAAGVLPIHLRFLVATLIGVGGVAALVTRLTGARAPLGSLRAPDLVWALVAGVGLALFGSGAIALERELIPALEPLFARKEALYSALLLPEEPRWIPVVFIVVALTPGVVEEWLFRGVLRDLMRRAARGVRVVTLGLLFSLMHLDPTVLLPMAYVGMVLTLIAERSGGWGAAAVAHITLNAIGGIVLSRLTVGRIGVEAAAVLVVGGAMLVTWAVARIRDTVAEAAPDERSKVTGPVVSDPET